MAYRTILVEVADDGASSGACRPRTLAGGSMPR